MNGKDILFGLGYIGDDLIEKSEYKEFPENDGHCEKQVNTRPSIHRFFLIAAVITTLLLLVGCAVIYVLNLKGIKLGDQTATREIYEYDPKTGEALTYVGEESYTQQVLTLAGINGTPASKAAREWYEFCENYDPDRQIQKSVWKNYPNFPAEYAGYGLYTQEMKEKLDEILGKYDLKLRGERMEFQTSKLLLRALGIENVLNPGSKAQMHVNHTAYYTNGNLDVYFDIALHDEAGTKSKSTYGYLYYRPKDCFIPDTVILNDAQWEEWNYTTVTGDNVLIIYSEDAASAWIFCDMKNCTATLRVDIIKNMAVEKSDGGQIPSFSVVSKAELEQIADAINFSLEPKLVEGWESLPDHSVPAGHEINGYSIEPVSAFTDGYGYQVVLRITAPEGVALTDPDDHTARVEAGNGVNGYCKEDGDGKLNTCHYILAESMSRNERPDDGSYPYPEGQMISVYWEDMFFTRFDFGKSEMLSNQLTEGTWKFNIPLSTADTREIELLSEPIIAKACIGWKMDGTDVLEDRKITSIKLHALGIDVVSEDSEGGDFLCFTGQFSHIVLKDGTWKEFTWHSFDDPIDLDQVAYVQLADKTIIPMPGVDERTVKLISEMVQAEWDAAYVPAPVFEDGVELLREPITMSHLAGYVTDSTGDREPLYEYLKITSVILHPDGLAIMGPSAFDSFDTHAEVVMKDGSRILLTGMGGSPYCDEPMSQLEAESAIDISKADHVLLPDGTQLLVPGK